MDEALRLGDRISIMQNGRIIQTGTAEDIVLAPADEYVAEFVRHMNPLTVLTAGMIMRRRAALPADGSDLWLDAARRYRLSLTAADEARELRLDGVAQALCHHPRRGRPRATLELRDWPWRPPRCRCSPSFTCARRTGHPVLLAEGGEILGVCGEAEIIRALAGGRHTSAGSP